MSSQPAAISVIKRTVAIVLFNTVTGCLGSSGRWFQLDRVDIKLNLIKPSLVYMYTHHGYQTSICGRNCAYYIRLFMVMLQVTID